jgi:hypothetical protein
VDAVSIRSLWRARVLGSVIAFVGFVAALANRDREVALLLGVLGIYFAIAADRVRAR